MKKGHHFLEIFKEESSLSVKKAGMAGALIGGIVLGGFAFLGIREAFALSSLFLKVPIAILAFFVGATIGGGLGIWANEYYTSESKKKQRR